MTEAAAPYETPDAAPPPAPPPSGEPPTAQLAQDLEATRAALAQAQQERDAALAAAQSSAAEVQSRLDQALADLDVAATAAVAARRRAILAENRGQVIDELVTGATDEELSASLEVARAAYTRVVEAVRAQHITTPVPAGATAGAPEPESLTTLERITRGLTRNGHQP